MTLSSLKHELFNLEELLEGKEYIKNKLLEIKNLPDDTVLSVKLGNRFIKVQKNHLVEFLESSQTVNDECIKFQAKEIGVHCD